MRFIVDAEGRREGVVLDVETYERLREAADELDDIAAYEAAIQQVRAEVAAGEVMTLEEYLARSAK